MTGGGAVAEPRQRLHPLTPLLRGGRLAVLAIAAISWQGYQNLGTQRWLFAIGAVAVMVLIGSVVSWFVTGYHVVGRELRIYDGLLWRRTRAIPLERLQAVEIVRPLLARLFGLAELKLEVVGGEKTEAPLAFLPVDDASALRKRLLLIARGGQSRRTGVAAAASGAGAGAGTGARRRLRPTALGRRCPRSRRHPAMRPCSTSLRLGPNRSSTSSTTATWSSPSCCGHSGGSCRWR
jgi:putative membrane protein